MEAFLEFKLGGFRGLRRLDRLVGAGVYCCFYYLIKFGSDCCCFFCFGLGVVWEGYVFSGFGDESFRI